MLVKAKKGFKVCRKSRGRYYSLYEMGFARLAFRKGTWTVPNKGCGPITLFAKLPDAEFLCRKSTIKCSAIVEVSYLPSENDAVAKPLGSVSLARLEDINASILIPGSTKLAQAVKMIKEMA